MHVVFIRAAALAAIVPLTATIPGAAQAATLWEIGFEFDVSVTIKEGDVSNAPVDASKLNWTGNRLTGRAVYDADVSMSTTPQGNRSANALRFIEFSMAAAGSGGARVANDGFDKGLFLVWNDRYSADDVFTSGNTDGVLLNMIEGSRFSDRFDEQLKITFTATDGVYPSAPFSLPTEFPAPQLSPTVDGYYAGKFYYRWRETRQDPTYGSVPVGALELSGGFGSNDDWLVTSKPYEPAGAPPTAPVPLPAGLPLLLLLGLGTFTAFGRWRRA